jgi:hypothetical protein
MIKSYLPLSKCKHHIIVIILLSLSCIFILLFLYSESQRGNQEKEKLTSVKANISGKLEVYVDKAGELEAKLNDTTYR